MKHLKIYLFAYLAIMTSCGGEISENNFDSSGGIFGIVSDKTTGEPVSTVNVSLEETGISTVTGTDGSFAFKGLYDNTYTILLSKEGYKDGKSTVLVSNGKMTESHLLIERVPAILTIDREVLDFGDNYSNTTLSFSMVNKNYVDLDWEIVYNCRWIKEVNPVKGFLGFGKTQTIVVMIDRDELLAGENQTVVVVRTSDGASELTVKAIGQQRKFPALNMLETTDIKASSAILHAEMTDNGVPEYTERGFVLSDAEMPIKETALKTIPAAVNSENAFSVRVGDLKLGTTYHVRAYAINQHGIAYSTNEDKFTTQAVLPTVVTFSSSGEDRETQTAILRGSITYEGDPAYTECGFVWSNIYENPTIEEEKIVVSMTGAGDYERRVTFADISKTIYVRAYAINQRGTAYGETVEAFPLEYIILKDHNLGVQRTDINEDILHWSDASIACKSSRVGSLSDWRLPTKDELYQLYLLRSEIGNFKCGGSSYGWHADYYWSSTFYRTYTGNDYYYYVSFYDGEIGTDHFKNFVRCVRTLN